MQFHLVGSLPINRNSKSFYCPENIPNVPLKIDGWKTIRLSFFLFGPF